MNKIDKLISIVLSELSDITMRTDQEWDQKVTYVFLKGDPVMAMRKHNSGDYIYVNTKKHYYTFSIFSSLPLYSIIYTSLRVDDMKTFFEKLTLNLLPLFSELLDDDVIKDIYVNILNDKGVGLTLLIQ